MPTHNREDATLDRLLGAQQTGFYVDVGANDPLTTSNTHHLYMRGWRGIDIEPNPVMAQKCRIAHPENVVFEGAANWTDGNIHLYTFLQHENSTILPSMMTAVRNAGKQSREPIVVQAKRLDAILQENQNWEPFAQAGHIIDFLSIDVEGAEGMVLMGTNLTLWHPRVICIEATNPVDLSIRTNSQFEHHLINAGYREVHFDGCNSWYMR